MGSLEDTNERDEREVFGEPADAAVAPDTTAPADEPADETAGETVTTDVEPVDADSSDAAAADDAAPRDTETPVIGSGAPEPGDASAPTDGPSTTAAASANESRPVQPHAEPAAETGIVPAFLGLFVSDETAPVATAAQQEPADAPASSPAEPPADTDSVRIFAEMFRGFRRGSAAAAPAAVEDPQIIDDGTDDEADAESVDEAAGDEATAPVPVLAPAFAPAAEASFADVIAGSGGGSASGSKTYISKENDVSTSEPSGGASAQPIKTTYVPNDASNETEQALAWLASENVASGQAPAIATAVSIVPRRRRRWVGAIIAPFVTALILAVVYVVAFAVWPLQNVAPTASEAEISTPVAPVANLPWPEVGQSAILVGDDATPLTPGGDEVSLDPVPTASLAKVITVMTILEKQPLAPGEDGPEYEFGWADKQQYDALLWSGESVLPVPVDGTLTYRQILEGIMLSSAGNYVNKLVDNLWDFNRDAFRADALLWLQNHGLSDTNLFEPTGINPQTQSTATDLVEIAKIAMQDPTFAEIVGEDEVVLPGAGLVENSNPLLGELGVVGIKTGHLNTWEHVRYNLMAAADVPLSDDPDAETVRVYSVVTGQPEPTEQTPFGQQTRELLQSVTDALQPVEAMAAGTVVGTVTAPWGASTNVIAADTAELSLWNGEEAEVVVDYDVDLGDPAGTEVGTVTITGEFGSTTVPLTTTKELPRPSIEWRLSHPLELLGFGK
ncbi:hypothetical protein GCM10010910_16430 [Microbacterium nanhaiense]|uniref:Peptidase S11 D-alanyl-D-alanine carboxypeptidase A N-terminal domain-containing protein n=1 Tax=Microbacterium nanhaiense TaxID=1301026 RepID=A0ABQ2N1U6_9MICO|nr:hypothetical protein [Microbacterium nanhaiense]GGO63568.1 hypothetical protein GCM10010910_16430 [Microbacterium nanhaiense]